MRVRDTEKQAAYARKHYAANRQAMIDRAAAAKAVHRARVREHLTAAKDVPCADCGHRYPHYVMQFDHVRGVKLFNLGDAAATGKTLKRIDEEIAKCDVVCANCHAARTWLRSH